MNVMQIYVILSYFQYRKIKQVMENQFQLDLSKFVFTLKVYPWVNRNIVS